MAFIDTTQGQIDEELLQKVVEVRQTTTGRGETTIYYLNGEVVRKDVTFYSNEPQAT